MWDFFETVRHRHSVRKYRPDVEVEEEKLHAIIEIALAAPSAGDMQSYQLIVVRDPARRAGLAAAAGGQEFLAEAPVCIAFCCDPAQAERKYGSRGRELFTLQDTTIAATYAQLAVVAAGMASAWVGAFDEDMVRQALDLAPGLRPIALLAVGYPAEMPQETPRRPMGDLVTFL